ncbi:hypothetical protein ARC20_16215 [Stenotrophomonas panacihumi]|uniref:Competence protein ComF n=1 Tax=Stenotrophomonas panacihumi TaxID=676599 RepID=A0A0Q9ZYW5_9GAMM|nr:ComF family protein [Stenotrophomonas panacihumi]KRG37769.1 hypothetical protein ARC20_16215 [Stenotrophomonas panacihumi]PTN56293.1 ComF family protein [Stenotrophomonas panacihumi]
MQNLPSLFNRSARRWLLHTQAWLLPSRCLLCDAPGTGMLDMCRACETTLPWSLAACPRCAMPVPAGDGGTPCGDCSRRRGILESTLATFVYQWPVDTLLRRFKFDGDLAAGRMLAQMMACRFAPASVGNPVLVPVPLHDNRLRGRGYDQAAELARPLASVLGLECRAILRRRIATAAQSSLDAVARRRNVWGAFQCVAPVPAHLVLVDDVMTTGATLQSAAQALRQAGARQVGAWVCARAP